MLILPVSKLPLSRRPRILSRAKKESSSWPTASSSSSHPRVRHLFLPVTPCMRVVEEARRSVVW